MIKQAAGTTWVHPAALFALTEAEIVKHAEPPRDYSWGHDDPREDAEEYGDAGETGSGDADAGGRQDGLRAEDDHDPAFDRDALDVDGMGDDGGVEQNAHLDDDTDDEPPVAPVRSRPNRRGRAKAA